MTAVARLLETLRASFAAHADAARAPAMQAYMKSTMPYYGIATPLRRELTAQAVRAHPLPDSASLQEVLESAPVQAQFQQVINQLAAESTGSATRVARIHLMAEPPSLD